jgi:hypothetical protein
MFLVLYSACVTRAGEGITVLCSLSGAKAKEERCWVFQMLGPMMKGGAEGYLLATALHETDIFIEYFS